MRDPKRIDRVLQKVALKWKVYPDLRLGQLLCIASGQVRENADPFGLEDSDLEAWAVRGWEGTMPGDSEHPVTVGDLFLWIDKRIAHYRPATVADLVSALRAEGVLDITKLIEYGPSGPQMTFRYVLNLTEDLSAEAER